MSVNYKRFECESCGWSGERYKSSKKCKCGGKLRLLPPNVISQSCSVDKCPNRFSGECRICREKYCGSHLVEGKCHLCRYPHLWVVELVKIVRAALRALPQSAAPPE